MAFALLSARPNSHPFQDRHISLKEVVKIGRAVAKTKPSPNNAVFDCKVLSRNHAIMWYENGKFMLQDTKSSNGTYVNTVRLSRGSEESEPYEIKSNDILQFGVEVVENSKNVTHGCVIGLVTLFHEDGTEALGSTEETPKGLLSMLLNEKSIQPQDLWQLCQFLQDALYREQQLESKLSTLQRLIVESHSTSHDAFQGFIKEDKLLSRLETLENQLELASKNIAEDEAMQKLVAYQEERLQYELTAKESLQAIIVQKAEVLRKLANTEQMLSNSEEECAHLKLVYNKLQDELNQLIEAHQQQNYEMINLKSKVESVSGMHEEKRQQYEKENESLREQLDAAERRGSALAVDIESLQAECDFTKQQLNSIKEKLNQSMALKERENSRGEDSEKSIPFASDHATLEKEVQNKSAYIQVLKGKLSEAYTELETAKQLRQDQSSNSLLLQQLKDELLHTQSCIAKLASIYNIEEKSIELVSNLWNDTEDQLQEKTEQEVKMDTAVLSINQMVAQLNNNLEVITRESQLRIGEKQIQESSSIIIKDELTTAHCEMEEVQNEVIVLGEKLLEEQVKNKYNEELVASLEIKTSNLQEENETLQMKITRLENECKSLKQENAFITATLKDSNLQCLARSHRKSLPTKNYENATDANDFHDAAPAEKQPERTELSEESILLGKMGNLVVAFFVLLVMFGALIMLGIIKVTPGTLPLVDERNWIEAWEHIIDYLF